MRKAVAVVVALFVVTGLVGCVGEDTQAAEYSRICVDQQTHDRVDGSNCGNDDHSALTGFLWWYLIWGRTLPAYGYPVHSGYQTVRRSAIVEHDEKLAPTGGKSYTKTTTRSYSNGSGKKLGTTKGGTGYKAPAPAAPKNQPKAPNVKAPQGGGYKAPVVKAPAPVYRPPAPVYRAPVRVGKY